MDAEKLRESVEEILLRKSTDLSKISRGQILNIISDEQPGVELLCEKAEVKEIIKSCFQKVSETLLSTENETGSPSSRHASSHPSSKVKTERNEVPNEIADEEYARKIHDELNGKSQRRSSKKRAATTSSSTKSKRKYKSDDIVVDSDEEDDPTINGSRGTTQSLPKKRKATKSSKATDENGNEKPKRGGGGLAKVYSLSEALAEVVGETQLARPAVVKKMWVYIKANQLQDPNNGSIILCDDNLRNLFGVATVSSFGMNKHLSKHLYDPAHE